MHAHLEIILPYVPNVEAAIEKLLAPFNEHDETNHDAFWDWYELGGRFSGRKLTASLDPEAVHNFNAALDNMKLTISPVQCGKPELNPISQAAVVDQLWREHFPHSKQNQCPYFKHAGTHMPLDIATLDECPMHLEAERFLIAGTYGSIDLTLRPITMLVGSLWNGVAWQDTKFDGTLQGAIDTHLESLNDANKNHRKANTPDDSWLIVTVDYHS